MPGIPAPHLGSNLPHYTQNGEYCGSDQISGNFNLNPSLTHDYLQHNNQQTNTNHLINNFNNLEINDNQFYQIPPYQNKNQYDNINSNHINTMLPHKYKRGYIRPLNLFQYNHIFPYESEKPQLPCLPDNLEPFACPPDFQRCSLNIMPQTHSLLNKIRLPCGIFINPFNDKQEIPLVADQVMARCKMCRTYINPFVVLLDSRHWKCNICYRTNEFSEEYYYDRTSGQFIQPYQRLELRNAAIEFSASADYMIRPPQPAIYVYLLEVTVQACKTDYINTFCEMLVNCLDDIPGDTRAQICFITFDRFIHFYRFPEHNLISSKEQSPTIQNINCSPLRGVDVITCPDIEEPFIPCEDNIVINLREYKQDIKDFLTNQLPNLWCNPNCEEQTIDTSSPSSSSCTTQMNSGNCLGTALQVAYKLISRAGGRITTFLHSMPNLGLGRLDELNAASTSKDNIPSNDEDESEGNSITLYPKTEYYKSLALEMSNDQVSADFFFLTQSHIDIATIAPLAKYTAGCMYYFPGYHNGIDINPLQEKRFESALKRYLTREIGFEAVLRIRCSKGIVPKGFYGNFFLRSSNLMCLPTVKQDTSYAIHLDVEDDLTDSSLVSIQSAILYTTATGERRIRVFTTALPVSNNFDDVVNSADQDVIVSLISVMASERCLNSNLYYAREGMINACQDFLSAYNNHSYITVSYSNLMCPSNLCLLPYRIHALLKNTAFKISDNRNFAHRKKWNTSQRSKSFMQTAQTSQYFSEKDERAFALYNLQNKPIENLLTDLYPQLYNINYLSSDQIKESGNEMSKYCSYIPIYGLAYNQLDERCSYMLDLGDNCLLILIHRYTPLEVIKDLFGSTFTGTSFDELNDEECEISPDSKLSGFVEVLQNEKSFYVPIIVIKDENNMKNEFKIFMYDDKTESSMSIHEFLLYIVKEIIS